MNLRLTLGLTAASALVALAYGCGSPGELLHGFGGGGSGANGHHHSTGTDGDGGGVSTFANGSGAGSSCATHCSADLHDVVDCNEKVVTACPSGQGCGKSGCVPACQAADDNKSSIGCDFYIVQPDATNNTACFAAFVANTWTTPIAITLERGGQMLDGANAARLAHGTGHNLTYDPLPNGKVPVGEVAIVFLSIGNPPSVACPAGVTPALATSASLTGTGLSQAFHLTTDAPVVSYDIYPYGGGQAAVTSATLLLPTSAWNQNYIAVDAYPASTAAGTSPTLDIVASQDGTTVTMNPKVNIVGGGGVVASAANTQATFTLNKGQIVQFSQPQELIGSPIESDKPIGVWGGHQCLNIETNVTFCDASHQQIPPVSALGSEYVGVRYRNRYDGVEESPPWRIVGAVDGTTLTYEPAPPAGAPTTLASGQTATFPAAGPFVVKSQDKDHPFYVSSHMSGCSTYAQQPGLTDCRGDPEFVNVLPPAEYLKDYVFFTDPTYPETNLVVVRKKDNGAFSDVQLDCAGTLSGWMPLGSSGTYEYTRIDLSTGNFQGQNGCDNGRHEIKSTVPFGLTVWGWGSGVTGGGVSGSGFYSQAVSYGYPAGASVQPINTVKVPTTPK